MAVSWRDCLHAYSACKLVNATRRVGLRVLPLQCGESARVAQQLADGYRAGRAARGSVEILRHLVVQIDLARLDQLRDSLREATSYAFASVAIADIFTLAPLADRLRTEGRLSTESPVWRRRTVPSSRSKH